MAEAPGTIQDRDAAFDAAFAVASKAAEEGQSLPSEDPPAGDDTTKAAAGDDTTKASAGDDTTKGAGGDDTTKAAAGEDTVTGAGALDDKTKPVPAKEPAKAPEKTQAELDAEKKQKEDLDAALADYTPNDEEKADLEHWSKEFPREAKAMEVRLKQLDRVITQRVYNAAQAVLEHVAAMITPAVKGYQETAQERHINTLRAAHADYDALAPELETWIKTQPAFLQQAMEATYKEGAAKDVVELYTRFKKDTGRDKPALEPKKPAPEPKKSTPSKDDVDALASVDSKRVTPSPKGSADPNDYDAAWKEALAAK